MMRARSSVSLAVLGLVSVVCACGSDGNAPGAPTGAAGYTAQAGFAGSSALATGSAGANASSGSSGTGAAGATGVSGSTSGGAAAVGGGGFSGSGASGDAGAATGGTAQAGAGGSGDDLAAAAILNRYQLLDPCQSSYKAVATPGDVCPQDTTVKNQHIPLQFGGDASVTYNVTLHVRAIMEGYWYSGGTLDPTSKTFYTGGVPTIGGFSSACKNKTSELPFALPADITPTDNCWNGFNMFALTVSEPNQHYYLNYTANKDSDRPPHAVYDSDYTVTIPIKGQAQLEFYIIGSDEHECYNFSKVVTGVATTPSPYIGEFVQFDVTNVTRAQ